MVPNTSRTVGSIIYDFPSHPRSRAVEFTPQTTPQNVSIFPKRFPMGSQPPHSQVSKRRGYESVCRRMLDQEVRVWPTPVIWMRGDPRVQVFVPQHIRTLFDPGVFLRRSPRSEHGGRRMVYGSDPTEIHPSGSGSFPPSSPRPRPQT